MSLLYSIMKPVARKFIKGSSLHKEETYEEFKEVSYKIQSKFRLSLPVINGYVFRDRQLDGFHIIIGKKKDNSTDRVIVYFPGGGCRRWQMPYKSSMKNYMEQTDAELWIPLYPLLPDHDMLDEAEFIVSLHKRMLRRFKPENIVWLGFSAGADIILRAGRHIMQKYKNIPMPGLMIPVSAPSPLISDEAQARMDEIDDRDIVLSSSSFRNMLKYYDPKGDLPRYIIGKADEDDYTGFPKIIMYYGGDEVLAGLAPDFEKSFIRCGLKDYTIKIKEGMPHAYPVFTFLKEGREGEQEIIRDINDYYRENI